MSPTHLALTIWMGANGLLFFVLTLMAIRISHRARARSVMSLARAFAVFSILAMASSAFWIALHHVDSAGAHPLSLLVTSLILAGAGTTAAVWGLARLRATLSLVEGGERMVSVLTDRVALDTSISEWSLSPRELEVVETIASGVTSDREIAEILYISPMTVATHVRNILRKAGLSSRMDVMLAAAGRPPGSGEPKRRGPERPHPS